MAQKSSMEVYLEYQGKLIKCLPMNNVLFQAKLEKSLLPSTVADKLKGLPSEYDKSSYFLKEVIKSALNIDDDSSFRTLLSVMKDSEFCHVEKLACEIEDKLEGSDTKSGMITQLRNSVITVFTQPVAIDGILARVSLCIKTQVKIIVISN